MLKIKKKKKLNKTVVQSGKCFEINVLFQFFLNIQTEILIFCHLFGVLHSRWLPLKMSYIVK